MDLVVHHTVGDYHRGTLCTVWIPYFHKLLLVVHFIWPGSPLTIVVDSDPTEAKEVLCD